MGPTAYCTPATVPAGLPTPSSVVSGCSVAGSVAAVAPGTDATTMRGALTPWPNPSFISTNACCCERLVGIEESSGIPKSMLKNGMAKVRRTTVPTMSAVHGRFEVCVANFPQKLDSGSALVSLNANGNRKLSILCPAKPNKAGSNVSAARIITPTPIAAATPSVRTSGIGTSSKPRSAIATVMPANIAAFPAVARAMPTASLTW